MEVGRRKLITAPTVEPVSTADVKEWMRIESGVTTDDNLIAALIKAIRRQIERETRRGLMTQTWDIFFDDPIGEEVILPFPPLQSVTGIYFTDTDDVEGSAVDSSLYIVDANDPFREGRIILKDGQSWDNSGNRSKLGTRIRFVCGYGATAASGSTAGSVPEDLVLAMKRIILTNYEVREEIALGTIAAKIPIDAQVLLAPYRIMRV